MELLVILVSESLETSKTDPFDNLAFIAVLDDESQYADERPESLLEWKDAEKQIFEGPLDMARAMWLIYCDDDEVRSRPGAGTEARRPGA